MQRRHRLSATDFLFLSACRFRIAVCHLEAAVSSADVHMLMCMQLHMRLTCAMLHTLLSAWCELWLEEDKKEEEEEEEC